MHDDIPLQCLDVRALLGPPTSSSTPASSLDLEWEHETLPVSVHDPSLDSWAALSRISHFSEYTEFTSAQLDQIDPTVSEWSRVSSADSLEWDPTHAHSPLRRTPSGSLDADTQMLLTEIERMTDVALRETGRTLDS